MDFREQASIAKLLAVGRLSLQTRENCLLRIRSYLRRMGLSPDIFVQEVGADPKQFEENFIRFIGEVSRTSASSTTAFWRDALKKFLEVNRVKGVDWEYINQFLPRVRKSGLDRAPTIEEIRKLVLAADLRTRCLILYLCSSGARVGSIEYLHWGDFQEVEFGDRKLARVTIYRGEPEQYDAFVTPECWTSLLAYKQAREDLGERVASSVPAFVWMNRKGRLNGTEVKPIGARSLKNQVRKLMNKMNMRSPVIEKGPARCYEFKQLHGFRKFFKTKMEMAGAKPIITEMLMGHALGVAGSYMKPTQREMLEEYSKALDNLTIVGPTTKTMKQP